MIAKISTAILMLAMLGPTQASDSNKSSIIDLSKLLKMEHLLEKIAPSQAVFVSETHTRYDHHLSQLAIIKSKHERHDKVAIGLEFIQQPFQSVLDDYIAGRIDEEAMLRGTDYFKRWGYDYRLYRPIFRYAREHGIPLIALNIDRDITDQIKAEGIDSLTDEQKKQVPAEIDRDDQAYTERLKEIFQQHPNSDEKQFASFIEIQLLWDESMAARAAQWFSQHPDGHMVILAGTGHIIYGSGIPDRLKRRQAVPASSVINMDGASQISADMGDFIIMTDEQSLAPTGKLGVILDTSQSPPGVIGFTEDSGAKRSGIEKADKIIAINDKQISSYFDIRMALMDSEVDQKVKVKVIRESLFFAPENLSYEVKLN